MENLPVELILSYALSLDLPSITHLCQTSAQFNEVICNNEYFWKHKFIRDYYYVPEFNGSWKHLYQVFGDVWSFGYGYSNSPKQIPNIKAKMIASGELHSMTIDFENNLWGFGYSVLGQLGTLESAQQENTSVPIQIPNFKAKSVSCGLNYTLFIDSENNLWGCGDSYYGRFRTQNREYVPIQIRNIKAKAVSCNYENQPKIIDMHDNILELGSHMDTQIPNIKAKTVACGKHHSMIIDFDDNVWSYESNNYGQLGLGDDLSERGNPILVPNVKARAIACGGFHSMIIDFENNVWSCGYNLDGELGLGDIQNRHVLTQIPNIKAKMVACGELHSLIVDLEGNVWSCGNNENGQLGLGDIQNRLEPTQIPNIKANAIACGPNYSLLIGFRF